MRWVPAVAAAVSLGTAIHLPNAQADIPAFPDLSGYTPVNVQDYAIALPNPGRTPIEDVAFVTPEGVQCSFLPGVGGTQGSAGCTSDHFPGAVTDGPYAYIDTISGIQTAGSTPYADGSVQGHKISVLPPFHSISVEGMICGVDDNGTTACKDPQGRGFILSSSWSGWLPKI